jgi:DNA-binding MarR family transcriptional regulator
MAPQEADPPIGEPVRQSVLDSLEQLIFAAVGLTTIALEHAAPDELTLQQWRAMVVIGRADAVRISDVASEIGISLPSASRLVARLDDRGYVSMTRDDRDRRVIRISLTARGSRVRRAVIQHRRFLVLAALGGSGVSVSDALAEELATLAEAFERYA